jgi:eukaryotic-like serine/threonine-protein kinase
MALQPGTILGPYEIISLIGAGGMGEVYRARDPRLGRDVAIKVLPADRVADEDRRRRFAQEAKAASALNHPHIITIHEIESANGHDFIVMEYVRGKSLDALIPRHGMRLGEVLRIAIPVADALAAAHARGIIHRDLKPANVMVGADGAVKVLDFGLAKLSGSDDAADDHPTHTADGGLSAPGTITGTAAYMSPEQATGGPVDARSDIFSFGALLYEMVTGVRAFVGTSIADTLAAVLRAQPKPPIEVVPAVPSDLQKVILRCLRKDPERRIQHMGDVKLALQEVKEESDSGVTTQPPVPRWRGARAVAVGILAVVVIGAGAWLLKRSPAVVPPMRVVPLTALPGTESNPTFSPDGDQVAFEWDGEKQDNSDIYVTLVGSSEIRRLTSDPAMESNPTWSPDGRQIAFLRARPEGATIQLVSALGGADRKLSDFRGADWLRWSPDGRWLAAGRAANVAGQPGGIYLIPPDGGDSRPLIVPTAGRALSLPAFSPDGRRLAYGSCSRDSDSGRFGDCDIYLVELDALVNPTGLPERLTTQRSLSVGGITWTRDGTAVVYSAGLTSFSEYLWRAGVDGTRPPERLEIVAEHATAPAMARSRDRLAFARVLTDADIYRVEAGRPAQLVVGSTFRDEMEPRLSPDGRRLVFGSQRAGDVIDIWVSDADGSNARQLTHGPGRDQGSPYWSPDGRRIAFDSLGQDNQFHIWMIDADGGTPRRITTKADNEHTPTWSRDGRSVYFSRDEGTKRDIWRVPASGGTSERLTHGGSGPFACESADGRSLLFQLKDGDSPLMAMSLAGGAVRQLVACVRWSSFGAGPQGVYYVPCDSSSNPPVHVLDLETGRDRRFGTLENPTLRPLGLSVSPDGRTIVYPRQTYLNGDLMLIENFR